MSGSLQALVSNVQNNCHIADAIHAGNYTLCIYLLKMRELFRWESGQGFNRHIDKEALGSWLSKREALWDSLSGSNFKPISIGELEFDPMDSQAINQQLLPQGLVYSAGHGNKAQPHFFLAQLEQQHSEGDYTIYISHKELARDLTAPPAMAQGNTIFIRRESFRRLLWEKYEEWLWNKPDNAMRRAIQYYPFDTNVNAALEQMTDKELNMALYHEIGEIRASTLLGEEWLEILAQLPRSRGEIIFRAVKDHLADSLSTLPQLLETFYPESLHFYMANLSSMRKTIAPQLEQQYQLWLDTQDLNALRQYVQRAKKHWLKIGKEMVDMRGQYETIKDYAEAINQLIEKNYL